MENRYIEKRDFSSGEYDLLCKRIVQHITSSISSDVDILINKKLNKRPSSVKT